MRAAASPAYYLHSPPRFAHNDALREISRTLKPGASLGVIWNVEDCLSTQNLILLPYILTGPQTISPLPGKPLRPGSRSLTISSSPSPLTGVRASAMSDGRPFSSNRRLRVPRSYSSRRSWRSPFAGRSGSGTRRCTCGCGL